MITLKEELPISRKALWGAEYYCVKTQTLKPEVVPGIRKAVARPEVIDMEKLEEGPDRSIRAKTQKPWKRRN